MTTLFGKILLSSLLMTMSLLTHAAPATVNVTQVTALQRQGTLLIDVRQPDEYAQGHAPGSTLIPLGQLAQRLPELAGYKNKPVALICHSGNRSSKAQQLLQQAGFTATSNVEGGMVAWQKAGLPVVMGSK
ncbi:MAG: rhodanese-like domain-containing protein [Comamonadaceae bacterium CG_4_10_14_0_8_um_filter_57_29]|nr:MAG: rhodanese-like domain-containing protein [Comamonadaceae bacterium CG_4_10_14_0_8_um_filter_57_29]